jgi:hypothetical protein
MKINKLCPAVATSFILSCFPVQTRANPAALAPVAFCAGTAGVGCVLVGIAIVGSTAYYIWKSKDGKYHAADKRGRVNNSERIVGSTKPNLLQSRAISGIDAAMLGDAHWAAKATDCYKIGKRIGKYPKTIHDATGTSKGFWCIFPGEQTNFGGDN